ncbi:hypothetical protein, partial [uncultured Alistipes sp.]|uniref:hypothetical protein n=1 Tax=uncultured Alistipes sp. TaxID=538949 RepID=UPI002593EF5F
SGSGTADLCRHLHPIRQAEIRRCLKYYSFVPSSEPNSDNRSLREQQAQEIMRQLAAEGILAPDEAAEIIFSDTAAVCVPHSGNSAEFRKITFHITHK